VLVARRQRQELRGHGAGRRALAQCTQAQQGFLPQFGQQRRCGPGRCVGGDIAQRAHRTRKARQQVAIDQLRKLEIGVVLDEASALRSASRGLVWPISL
jgi:hypothetical protein